jgi:hypothetical protein
MTREEWIALPPAVALGLLYDWSPKVREEATNTEAPRRPLSPKFDMKIWRKNSSFHWASELTLESLEFWHRLALESVAKGGEWAEKDAKRASNLERWIAWRKWEPEACWSGERNDKQTTARPPSKSPELHSQMPTNDAPQRGDAAEDW